jgi:hypothetical protein
MSEESSTRRENALDFLDELDERHDFLLDELEQLNTRIDAVLNEYTKSRQSAAMTGVSVGEQPNKVDALVDASNSTDEPANFD